MSPAHRHQPGPHDPEPTAASGPEWRAYFDWRAETEHEEAKARAREAAGGHLRLRVIAQRLRLRR